MGQAVLGEQGEVLGVAGGEAVAVARSGGPARLLPGGTSRCVGAAPSDWVDDDAVPHQNPSSARPRGCAACGSVTRRSCHSGPPAGSTGAPRGLAAFRDERSSAAGRHREPTTDLARAFELLTDCVAVLDERGDVVDVNPFMLRLLGFERDEVLGRSMAEFVHPDDLERAIRVMSMVGDDTLEVPDHPGPLPRPPARRRLPADRDQRHPVPARPRSAGEARPAGRASRRTSRPTARPAPSGWSIVGRYSADRDLEDQIMARLLSGESPTAVIELVPGFGRWRHQLDHYAVVFNDEWHQRAVAGTDEAVELVRPGRPRLAVGPGRRAPPGGPGGARRHAARAGPGRGRPGPGHVLGDPGRRSHERARRPSSWCGAGWAAPTSTCTPTPWTPWPGPWPWCCSGATR